MNPPPSVPAAADQPDESRLFEAHEVMSPRFRFDASGKADGPLGGSVYMETFIQSTSDSNKWQSRPSTKWQLIASVTPDRILTYPTHANPHAQRYLRPKYPIFRCIAYQDGLGVSIPATVDDVIDQIQSRLPAALFSYAHEGFGLVKELYEVVLTTARLVPRPVLVVMKDGDSRASDEEAMVSESDMDALRKSMNRIDKRRRDGIRQAKQVTVFNDLLTKLDPVRFMRSEGRATPSSKPTFRLPRTPQVRALQRRAGAAAIAQVHATLPTLAADEPAILMELRAEIERVTLSEMIVKYEALLEQDLSEPRWQAFFEAHEFVLGMVFARPVRLVRTQFHAQVSSLDGSGAQIGDFLFRQSGQGLAIAEIKKPSTELLSGTPYRKPHVFAPSKELSGAITQTLHQQNALRSHWLLHRTHDDLSGSNPDEVKCIVVAGTLPADEHQLRSFNTFRNACKDVEVVTFDELLGKLHHIRDFLGRPPPQVLQPEQTTGTADLF
jgi:hypothetical protein